MIRQYIDKAMSTAHYEMLSDDGSFYGEIAACPGVLSNEKTLEACRSELEEVLEEWVLLRIHRNLAIPKVDGLGIAVSKAEVA